MLSRAGRCCVIDPYIYDHMLTFGDEVRYMWSRPFTNIKVLYIILRYSTALGLLVYFQGETLSAYSCVELSK